MAWNGIILVLLAADGWGLSLYFFLVYRGRIDHRAWWVLPPFRMTGKSCRLIVDTDYGRVFRYPNMVLGLFYYPLLIVLISGNDVIKFPPDVFMQVLTVVVLAFSAYLALGLYRLKVKCRTCLGTHLINLLIFGLVLVR